MDDFGIGQSKPEIRLRSGLTCQMMPPFQDGTRFKLMTVKSLQLLHPVHGKLIPTGAKGSHPWLVTGGPPRADAIIADNYRMRFWAGVSLCARASGPPIHSPGREPRAQQSN